MLKQVTTKHKHFHELVYREEHEVVRNNPRQMSVTLNFLDQDRKEYKMKRVLNPTGVFEYSFNENPLIAEEYVAQISKMNL